MEVRTRNTGRSARFAALSLRRAGVLIFGLAGALSSCSPSTSPVGDLGTLPTADLCVSDLSTGPNCGTMLLCMVGCGLNNLSCNLTCAAGVNSTEALKAIALAVCAAQNCSAPDAGTGTYAILACLLKSCPTEVAACDGLPGS